jgi:Zn-finger nucleic acid-binding protein
MIDAQVKQGMLCPVCKTDLMMTDRQGVEVDYCPRCRGVWLDRGELDKIMERSAAMEAQPQPMAQHAPAASHGGHDQRGGYDPRGAYDTRGGYDPRYEDRRPYRRDDDDDYYKRHHHHRRKKSWLGDILDFD